MTDRENSGGYRLKKHLIDSDELRPFRKLSKNELKSTTYIKAKHMINSATVLTIRAAEVFVQLYCVLATESNEDKATLRALLLAKKSTI